jgi:hypothetical protein
LIAGWQNPVEEHAASADFYMAVVLARRVHDPGAEFEDARG